MDIFDLLASFRQLAPEFASSYCIVNGAVMNLNEIQNMGYDEFSLRSKSNMPLRLYRYYPNKKVKDKKQAKKSITLFKHWKITRFFFRVRPSMTMYMIRISTLIIPNMSIFG